MWTVAGQGPTVAVWGWEQGVRLWWEPYTPVFPPDSAPSSHTPIQPPPCPAPAPLLQEPLMEGLEEFVEAAGPSTSTTTSSSSSWAASQQEADLGRLMPQVRFRRRSSRQVASCSM
jgi:hypothetical protein